MAKVSAVERNLKRQRLVAKYAAKRALLKDIARNKDCQVTGRPRGYYRKMKMSRIALRELGSMGLVPGLVKSSW